MKIIVGITGASSVHLGISLANEIVSAGHEVCAIISDGARVTFESERAWEYLGNSRIPSKNSAQIEQFLDKKINIQKDMRESAASGSSGYEAMIIAPCSSNTLAKVANGICDNLLVRAAAVMLKERRKLIIAPREMPFSPISLKQMSELSSFGVIFAPPMIAHYSSPKSLEDAENFIIGKWCDCLEIKNNLFKRWEK